MSGVFGCGVLLALSSAADPTLTHSGTPSGIDPNTDCAIRKFAWEYGRKLQPSRGEFKSLYDALQLGACGVPTPTVEDSWSPPASHPALAEVGALLYTVDPRGGDDALAAADPHQGLRTSTTAFRTVAAAVAATRGRADPATTPAEVVLKGGEHYLDDTISLTATDSHLTIRNAEGEAAVVSGGQNLTTVWKPSTRCKGCFEADLSGQGVRSIRGLRRNGVREIRARYPNFDPELDSTINGQRHYHDGQDGWITQHTEWIPSTTGTINGISPWPPVDTATTFVMGAGDWPGVEWPMDIMTNGTVDPNTWTGEGEWGQYWLGAGGTCVDRSPPVGYWCAPGAPRHISTPNHPSGISADSMLLPNSPYKNATGAVVHAWRPGHWYTNSFEVGSFTNPSKPGNNVSKTWQMFPNTNNVFGRITQPTVDVPPVHFIGVFNSTEECFAAANSSKKGPFHSFTFHKPQFGGPFGSHCYGDTSFTWIGDEHQQNNIDSAKGPGFPTGGGGNGAKYMFSRGGIQGGEGVTGGEAWYVENVVEELDMGREWFYDQSTQTLLYMPNSTDASAVDVTSGAPTGSFVATKLKVLFNVTGTMAEPAHHVSIKGVTLRDTEYTYFDPHGLPSGGDWALQQQGAITLIGTEAVAVDGCLLTRLDGNAIFIGGYNRNLSITNNEFSFIGDGAMASWGDTSEVLNENKTITVPGGYKVGPDGRGGEQPRGTVVKGNICHEIGLWQKQSSLWFQAVTAQTTLQDNIFYNGPRAAFNFNDGFGGGDDISGNLLLNCVRESSDHGPWNSWSRVPYITNIRTGKPSIIPATRNIHHNFILATYFSQQAIDTDDGSAYYEVYDNFFAYGDNGLKSDFGGHDNKWHGNVLAYVGNCYHMGSFKGYNDAFYGNQCVFRFPRIPYGSDCGVSTGWEVHNNAVFSRSGKLEVCGMDFEKYLAEGHDKGSSVAAWPTDEKLVAMGKTVLGM